MSVAEHITQLASGPARFTPDEFMELVRHPPIADWLGKVELVNGEIMRMSPANVPHWNAQRIAFLRLQSAFAALGTEWIVGQEPTVRLTGNTLREPDVAVLRDPDLRATLFDRVALFLAVEIADTSLALDLGAKRSDYADAFVPHYWVVDINARRTHVMAKPRAGDYEDKRLIPFGQPIAIPELDIDIVVD